MATILLRDVNPVVLLHNVGVGVSDPDQALEVGGIVHISAEQGSSPSAPSDGDGGLLYTKSGGKLYWRSNDISEVDLTAASTIGAGTVNKVAIWSDGDTIFADTDLHWDSTNNRLGIGTSVVLRELHIHNSTAVSTYLQITNSSTGEPSSNDGFQFGIGNDGTANIIQRENLDLVFHTNNLDRGRIDKDGNFGINNTNPDGKLTVTTLHSTYNSDVTGSGTASSSGYYGNLSTYHHDNAFDNDSATYWGTPNSAPDWIKLDFGSGSEKTIVKMILTPESPSTGTTWDGVKDFKLQASNNDTWTGSNYVDLLTVTDHPNSHAAATFIFANTTAYRYYRVYVSASLLSGRYYTAINEIEMMESVTANADTLKVKDGRVVLAEIPTSDPTRIPRWGWREFHPWRLRFQPFYF